MNLPPEKRSKGKSSTINTLKYALRCVKQVKGKRPPGQTSLWRFGLYKASRPEMDFLESNLNSRSIR